MRNPLMLVVMVAIYVALAGCATQKNVWVPLSEVDKFADVETKIVTVGDSLKTSAFFPNAMLIYPFVSYREGEIAVGLRSTGRFKMPTGTVQLRVDNNKAWTIGPEETPIYLVPESAQMVMPMPEIDTSTAAGKQTADAMALTKSMTESMQAHGQSYATKMVSPFTAATDEKAKAILREMLAGNKIIYRTVGYNQASSVNGEVAIDASFLESLKQIGITEAMLK